MTTLQGTPQAPSQILSVGIGIGANSFPKLFLFTTLAGFLGLIPVLFLAVRVGDVSLTREVMSAARDGTWYLIEIICVVASILIQAVMLTRLDNLVQRGTTDFNGEARHALRVLLPLIAGTIVAVCALIVGYVLLLVPGVILTISLAFFQFCVVLDHQGPIEGLNRSHTLVWGNWWRTLLVIILMLLVVILIAVVLLVPFALMLGVHPGVGTGRSLLVQGVLEMVAEAVFSPFILAVMYVQYHDLKVRRALLTGS
ncbi:MAG: hypothetical protein ACRESU_09320 [Gammaproteobacteria bacterium]